MSLSTGTWSIRSTAAISPPSPPTADGADAKKRYAVLRTRGGVRTVRWRTRVEAVDRRGLVLLVARRWRRRFRETLRGSCRDLAAQHWEVSYFAASAPRFPRSMTSAGGRSATTSNTYHHIAYATRAQMTVITGCICK